MPPQVPTTTAQNAFHSDALGKCEPQLPPQPSAVTAIYKRKLHPPLGGLLSLLESREEEAQGAGDGEPNGKRATCKPSDQMLPRVSLNEFGTEGESSHNVDARQDSLNGNRFDSFIRGIATGRASSSSSRRRHRSVWAKPLPRTQSGSIWAPDGAPPAVATVTVGNLRLRLRASGSKTVIATAEETPAEPRVSTFETAPNRRALHRATSHEATTLTEKGCTTPNPPQSHGHMLSHRKSVDNVSAADYFKQVSSFSMSEGGSESIAPGQVAASVEELAERRAQEAVWVEVFNKVKDDGELHHDDLPRALELVGYSSPNRAWMDDIFAKITKFSTLEEDEFVRFLRHYELRQHQAHAEAFVQCDNDGSGMVESAELAELLKSFGIEPMRHVLEEVFNEVDEDRGGSLDLREFKRVMELLWTREGFSKRAYEECMDAYHKFDRDKSGVLDTKETISVLQWLGYATEPEVVIEVIKEVDVNNSGTLNEREFMVFMRKMREHEAGIITEHCRASGTCAGGSIADEPTTDIFRALGYPAPDPTALQEAAQAAGVDPGAGDFDLSEFWRLLTTYRARDGFNVVDMADIEQAFERYDRDRTGEICALDTGKLLRWLGYPAPFEVTQHYICRVDVDESGKLNVHELRKMIRMLWERQLGLMREAFREQDQEGEDLITKDQAVLALQSLGYLEPRSKMLERIFSSDLVPGKDENLECINLVGFVDIAIRFARSAREAIRKNGGFSAAEVRDLEHCFKKYDKDDSGDISNAELIHLIEDIFPEMASDESLRPQLIQLMKEVAANGHGSLDFLDFLHLMRQFFELQDKERVAKEQLVVRETGFSAHEVDEFRELFLAAEDCSGSLALEELKRMLHAITPLGDRYVAELTRIFRSVTEGQMRHAETDPDSADFPEFLWIMRQLLDTNFANIKEKTKQLKA